MTRIDAHAAQPSLMRMTETSVASHDEGHDFLHHLAHDKPGAHGQEPSSRPPHTGKSRLENAVRLGKEEGGRAGDSANDTSSEAMADMLRAADALQAGRRAVAGTGEAASSRIYEQHWFANGYLSFVSDSHAQGVPGVMEEMTGPMHASPDLAMPMGGTALSSEACIEEMPARAAGWPVVLEALGEPSEAPARSIERLMRALGATVASDQPWPARMLRLIARPDGALTLWVRDYALAPQQIGPLVAHLRNQAQQAGVVVVRVMVNGAVAWQSESIEGEN